MGKYGFHMIMMSIYELMWSLLQTKANFSVRTVNNEYTNDK